MILCATCGLEVKTVFYQAPVRRDECTACYDRRTGRKKPVKEEDVGRNLEAESAEMRAVVEAAVGMALTTKEEVAEFEGMLGELRARKQGLIDALHAYETAEDALLDALDRGRLAVAS